MDGEGSSPKGKLRPAAVVVTVGGISLLALAALVSVVGLSREPEEETLGAGPNAQPTRPLAEVPSEAEPADERTATAAADYQVAAHEPGGAAEAAPVEDLMAQNLMAPSAPLPAAAPAHGAGREARGRARPALPHRTATRGPSLAGFGAAGGGAMARQQASLGALPQNAVLSSSFVGGNGAAARLDDLMDRGVMVDGQNVRLQAFEELGRLPYPVPSDEAVGLHAELERGQLLADGERVHLQIALMARQGEAPPRPRMDVRLVLDRSGSMMGDKWQQAVAAAHQLVDRLQPGDTFGLVSYSDDASLDLPPARVGDRHAAHTAVDALYPGGGTNIEAALRMAAAHAPTRHAMNDVLLVVLVSDGVATIGQTNASQLAELARGTFDRGGVLTTTIGLGSDFDEDTMLSIAREGSGSYHFVRRASDVGTILTDELEERAQAVAQALRLRIELGEGVVATRVYGSQVLDEEQAARVRRTEIATDQRLAHELGITRNRQHDEERGLRIHVPTFRRGDQHVVLMELQVPRGTRASDIAHVSLEYKDLDRPPQPHRRGRRAGHADPRSRGRAGVHRAEREADRPRVLGRRLPPFGRRAHWSKATSPAPASSSRSASACSPPPAICGTTARWPATPSSSAATTACSSTPGRAGTTPHAARWSWR